jgi:lysyl-tRNA synthetase class 2
MDLADANGWNISVLAANASWLPVYHAAGLQDIYMGDEAIVDCQTFSLQGKAMKSLRGAHNRMSKNGYRVQMYDPCNVDAKLKDALLSLMTETRQGEAERGFSMTLGRIFDPDDKGLLLAVCLDADGNPKAFNQYIPASAVGGYSLDLMRRTSDPDAPNGLTDFVIIETIAWMREKGMRGLGLNFAVMRAVLAGEEGTGPWRTIERRTLHHYSDTMQIESLWKFNQKYDPLWRPRYVVTDAVLNRPRAGIAIARAESVFELPVIGKLLEPRTSQATPELTGAGRPPAS